MIQFKKILLPTDFSEQAAVTYAYAKELGQVFRSEIHLLHIYEPVVFYSEAPVGMPDMTEIENNIRESSLQSLEQIAATHFEKEKSENRIHTVLLQGKPFLEIIRYAREKSMDLIIIGSHGRSALEHILLGSVTEKVVRKAPCPVLTVRAQKEFVMP